MKVSREELVQMIVRDEDITQVDVSEIIDMSGLFAVAVNFNQDISGWDVSQVTNMGGMFLGAKQFNQTLNQ